MDDHLEAIRGAVIQGRHQEIEGLVQGAIDGQVDINRLINEAMIGAMDTVGHRFAEGEIFVPEMLVSSMTMKKGLDLLKPLLKDDQSRSKGTVILCTVRGDIHDIGKNLVGMMLEGAGFQVIDMGVDMTVERLIEKVEVVRPEVLGLSALLTTSMPEMKKVIEALESKGLREEVKVMIGGAPVDAIFGEEVRADGYGKDATDAVKLARRFLSERPPGLHRGTGEKRQPMTDDA